MDPWPDIPLCFGTPEDPAIIDPRQHVRRRRRLCRAGHIRLPTAGIIGFFYMRDWLARISARPGLREHAWLGIPLVDFPAGRRRVACATLPAPGAPAAAIVVEDLWAAGLRRLVLVGAVGVLRDDLRRGSLIIPTEAIRDEGTSYHYLAPGAPAQASASLRERLGQACRSQGISPCEGKTWTTDAIYRETWRKVERFRAEGAVCVEMEAATCFAVAAYRGIELAALFYAGDSVARPQWQHRKTARHLARASRDQDWLLDIALEALVGHEAASRVQAPDISRGRCHSLP